MSLVTPGIVLLTVSSQRRCVFKSYNENERSGDLWIVDSIIGLVLFNVAVRGRH